MNWLPPILKYLGPVLLLVVLFYEYRLKHVTPDARTTEHRKTSKIRFLILFLAAIVGLVALAFDDLNKRHEDAVAKKDKNGLNMQVTNLTSKVTAQSSIISNISLGQVTLLNELSTIVTNATLDAGMRERIIANVKLQPQISDVVDLNSWQAKLNSERAALKIQSGRYLEAEQALYEKCSPYYGYAVKRLTNLLENLAATNGDIVSFNYCGLPTAISPDIGDTNVAEIKFKANTNWDFQVQIDKRDITDGRRCLTIKGKNAFLDITPFFGADRLDAYLHILGEETIPSLKPLSDANRTIDESLGMLIAAQAEQSTRTNR